MGKSNKKSSATPTLISKGCVLHGKIESNVFMRVDGNIEGDLFIDEKLIIGEDGFIDGNIQTNEVIVYGTVKGSVKANLVYIKSSGKILGGLNTSVLHIEKGAVHVGSVVMKQK